MSLTKKTTNLELTSLIWLDNMANATQENREFQEKLRSIVNSFQTFDNCQECENYLRKENNPEENPIILVVSGRLGEEIIDRIHHLKQILSIFVFCLNKEKNELWAKKYKKVRGVLVQVDDLLEQIESERQSDEHKFHEPMRIYSDEDELIPILLQINCSFIDRRQFLTICSKEYEGNRIELEKIEDFEHLYSSSDALTYFFKETFLYRLLIKSLQIFHIDLLFLLRFFLQDIEEQLKSLPIVSTAVYHAQLINNNQLDLLKTSVNKTTLRFNSYLVAKQNRDEVLQSLQNSPNPNSLNAILFHIGKNPFGRLFQGFILFPVTIQFRILSIDYHNRIYIVKIIVSSLYLNHKHINPIALAYRLRHLGRVDEAEQILHRLLSQYPKQSSKFYDELAQISQEKGFYELSLQYYDKSLVNISSKNRPYCLNNIGCIYDYLGQYQLALDIYSKSLTLMKTVLDQAMVINNIGITLANQQRYEDALQSFGRSLTIRKDSLLEYHPEIGISYANLGTLYSSINESDLALEYYQHALKIFSENSSSVYLAIVYQNLAQISHEKNQVQEASDYYQQSMNIFRQSRSSNHPHPNLFYIEQMIHQLKQIK